MPASRASSCDKATKLAPVSTSMRTRLPSRVGWTTKWPRRSAETMTRLPLSAALKDSALSFGMPMRKSAAICSLAEVAESTVEIRIPEAQTIGRGMTVARSCGTIIVRRREQVFNRASAGFGFQAGWFPNSFRPTSNAVMREDAREARNERPLGRNGIDRDGAAGERAGEKRDPSLVADGGDAF